MRTNGHLVPLLVACTAAACGTASLALSCRPKIPEGFRKDPAGWQSPTGESEAERYTRAYEAFWWNCVAVKGDDLGNRCPFMCSGTPAATEGCTDGAMEAEAEISRLTREFPAARVRAYLSETAAAANVRSRMGGYFAAGPAALGPRGDDGVEQGAAPAEACKEDGR
jgi:hypothetical protein